MLLCPYIKHGFNQLSFHKCTIPLSSCSSHSFAIFAPHYMPRYIINIHSNKTLYLYNSDTIFYACSMWLQLYGMHSCLAFSAHCIRSTSPFYSAHNFKSISIHRSNSNKTCSHNKIVKFPILSDKGIVLTKGSTSSGSRYICRLYPI